MAFHAGCVQGATLRGPEAAAVAQSCPGVLGSAASRRGCGAEPGGRRDFVADLGPGPHRQGQWPILLEAQERSSCLRARPACQEASPDPAPRGHSGAPAA